MSSGSKTYITNGQNADLIDRRRQDHRRRRRQGHLAVPGRGRPRGLQPRPQPRQDRPARHDTSELFFDDVRCPPTNCLGAENDGFAFLMNQLPQERLSIAVQRQAAAQRAFDEAVKFTKDRKAFGKRCSTSRTPTSPSPTSRPSCRSAGPISTGRSRAISRASSRRRGQRRQAVAHRAAMGGLRRRAPAPRRRRLYERISDRPPVARRPRDPHLRRHQRDHEGSDRAIHRLSAYSESSGNASGIRAPWTPALRKEARNVHRTPTPPISR